MAASCYGELSFRDPPSVAVLGIPASDDKPFHDWKKLVCNKCKRSYALKPMLGFARGGQI
eukprot:6563-Pyramimonas_sp.AAC.1